MTRIHFRALAEFAKNANISDEQVELLMDYIKQFNPNFKPEQFKKACT